MPKKILSVFIYFPAALTLMFAGHLLSEGDVTGAAMMTTVSCVLALLAIMAG